MLKIALEEHFLMPGLVKYAGLETRISQENFKAFNESLLDLGAARIELMDKAGIDIAVLSARSPSLQAETDPQVAVACARETNDQLADAVAASNGRYRGFASLPTADPAAAADELERCVRELGFVGVMINGYQNTTGLDDGTYLDEDRYSVLWERLAGLSVPLYLHPRVSLPSVRSTHYAGYPDLEAASWGYGVETAVHALRLIRSGLFDRFPAAQVVLGHLGEMLPAAIWRIDNQGRLWGKSRGLQRSMAEYFRQNFYVTTSGQTRFPVLQLSLSEIGEDRVLFASDHPFESMVDSAAWLDHLPLAPAVVGKLAAGNAARLLGLEDPNG